MLSLYDLGRPLPVEPSSLVPATGPVREHLTAGDHARRLIAAMLRTGSAILARHARQVARPLHAKQRRIAAQADPVVEFHGEAGAPEGALYVDGRLVGYVDTRRL